MNWLSILKNKRSFKDLRQLREEGVREGKQRRKSPTPMSGGDPQPNKRRHTQAIAGGTEGGFYGDEKEPFDETEEDRYTRQSLANSTLFDLKDKVRSMLDNLTQDELIDILIASQGEVGILGIKLANRRGK
jgi:hypothetical protein